LRGAAATCPDDGRSWDELRAAALARLAGREPNGSVPPTETPPPPPAPEEDDGHAGDGLDGVGAVQHRVRVSPLERREVEAWQSLLQRLPPVLQVEVDGFQLASAVFRVQATSIRHLLRELRRAARTMQADFSAGLDETSIHLWSDS
jgi:hypothetical protein